MSAQPIDYDALAQQHGGAAAIDYDALASQHGGAATMQPHIAQDSHAEISVHPGGVKQWLTDLESDLRYGGTQTAVGRALKSAGYQGAETLGDESHLNAAGKTLVSPLTGPVFAAHGVAEAASGHPLRGAGEVLSGIGEAAEIPTSFAAPEASEAGAEAASNATTSLKNAIPSAKRAGAAFQDVMSEAKDTPVNLTNSQDSILRMIDWQKKTQLGPTVNKFLNRVTNPKMGDLTYQEGRDFYQLLGRLSADETMKMAPPVRRDLTQMVVGLKQDIGNTAEAAGKGQEYYSAMKEFRNAKRMEDLSDASKDVIIKALKYGIGGGIAGFIGREAFSALDQK